mmetsp:Transcript_66569/g.119811  ORF Transcript_66569/g.119811 Transcript_66569/m.119811 type:complete len:204 (+) Transcript_66569:320-931(+)
MPSGFKRTIGMSAQPGSLCFFSSLHIGRVTAADDTITTFGGPSEVSTNSSPRALSPRSSRVAMLKVFSTNPKNCESGSPPAPPETHHTAASAPSHAAASALPSPASQLSSFSRWPAACSASANWSLALSKSREIAMTCWQPFANNSDTTSRPSLPVAPMTATEPGNSRASSLAPDAGLAPEAVARDRQGCDGRHDLARVKLSS